MLIYSDFDFRRRRDEIIPMHEVYEEYRLSRNIITDIKAELAKPTATENSYRRGIAHGFIYAACLLLAMVLLWITKI